MVSELLIAAWIAALAGGPPRVKVPDPVAWQAALDRAGFSPGVIDGTMGDKTLVALQVYQAANDLPATGRPDAATRALLGIDSASSVERYVVTSEDVAAVGPCPQTWPEKAKAGHLGYKSLSALVAERGHCTQRLVARLNPKVRLDRLAAGDSLLLPNVEPPKDRSRAASLEIDLTNKRMFVVDRKGSVLALFHCSIAKDKEKRPAGSAKVKVISRDPSYLFDPAMWPEVKDVDRKLLIPPGPRNPVGLCWIGLSLPGYGIHGTPEPEMIGKTGSHGCFRLTNWDALRLGGMLRVGTPVRFVEQSTLAVAIQEKNPSRRR